MNSFDRIGMSFVMASERSARTAPTLRGPFPGTTGGRSPCGCEKPSHYETLSRPCSDAGRTRYNARLRTTARGRRGRALGDSGERGQVRTTLPVDADSRTTRFGGNIRTAMTILVPGAKGAYPAVLSRAVATSSVSAACTVSATSMASSASRRFRSALDRSKGIRTGAPSTSGRA